MSVIGRVENEDEQDEVPSFPFQDEDEWMAFYDNYLPTVSKKKRVLGGVVMAHKRASIAKREFESIKKTGMVSKGKPVITNKRFLKFLSFSSKFSKEAQELR